MVFIDENIKIVTSLGHHFLKLLVICLASFPCLLQDCLQKNNILPNRAVQNINLKDKLLRIVS